MTNQSNLRAGQAVPFSQEAEEAVIGAVLVNPRAFLTVATFLKADDFYLLRHNYIWQGLTRLNERSDPVDYLTVLQELRDLGVLDEIGGAPYITRLINSAPTSAHAEVYGRLVERASIRRKMLIAADEIKALALNEELSIETVTNDAEQKLFGVTENQLNREFVPMWDAISEYYDRLEHLMQNQHESLGLPSGFKDLDQLLGGFQKSDLLVFAGRPGMGKCVAAGTLIHTAYGLVPIEALKPTGVTGIRDDEGGYYYPLQMDVQTPEGSRQTAYFYDSGMRPTLQVTTRAGYTLTGTHNHPLLVLRSDGEKVTYPYVWKPLSELQPGDSVMLHSAGQPPSADEIIAIEDAGMQHCYDLTVPDGHTFVANGFVNHNTSFMLSVALNAARIGGRVAIFTMEMGVEQMVQRIISMETGINMQKLRLAQLNPREAALFTEVVGRIGHFPIFIDDTPALSPMQVRTKARRLAHEHGIDMIMLDYMQLMNAGDSYKNNRVQEISYISRSLKELARELNVPVFSAAQLSRAVEQRQDKRPVLSDLRESGCLAGESLIYLHDEGRYVPIRDLVGKTGFRVTSLNTQTWKLEPGVVTNAFSTGIKTVYKLTTRLGRSIRATGNHKFLTICGWKRLDELTTADHIALPRLLHSPEEQTMTDAELALLGHLIGDGCTLPKHAIQYTTVEQDLAEQVADLAVQVFGDAVRPRIHKEPGRNWYQVFLPPTAHLTHGVRNPVGVWLEELGAFGLRSHEKRIPDKVFAQPRDAIALFLRHLWATDGCITMKKTAKGVYPAVYYATSSEELAYGVQSLLLRLEINARLKRVPQTGKGRDQFHVLVSGAPDLECFVDMGAVGTYKQQGLDCVADYLATHPANTNRDVIPRNIWHMYAVPAMQYAGITSRQMQAKLGNAYCGTGLYKQNISRDRAGRLAEVVQSEEISQLAMSDVYWDQIACIEADGEEQVYDLTIDKYHNFVSCNTITHNSIEQDADAVMFLYRDVIYNEATEFPNQADIIVAKHRNGPTGVISLYFEPTITKFMDGAVRRVDLSDLG